MRSVDDGEFARRWLAARGVSSEDGRWARADGVGFTVMDAADAWNGSGLEGGDLVRLALGLVDLLDGYWLTAELRRAVRQWPDDSLDRVYWDGYRERLERPVPLESIEYSLWVDWFEDRQTAPVAFAEVLGNDVERLRLHGQLSDLGADDALFRRATRVLRSSGPVPWPVKHGTYECVATAAALHPALFAAILASYHDIYGDLEPRAALALLNRLELPTDTEHLARLRTVLAAGSVNHYRDPGAWRAAGDDEVPPR
jgi:hypothetical protein